MVFCGCIWFSSCENRQQPTWILTRKLRKMVCMCVCSAFFFSFALIKLKSQNIIDQLKQRIRRFAVTKSFILFCLNCFWLLCENRQQPTWILARKLRKMVCMCVCSVFFSFFLHNCETRCWTVVISNVSGAISTPLFLFVFYCFSYDVRE